ncbi:hypothetical protein AX16_002551 [Volvariella volvacea WC 439]|nr:hypothetical protein AX16_002551 [Volvariella volvacea WC 439]
MQNQPDMLSDTKLVEAVSDEYTTRAKTGVPLTYARNVAEAFGYTQEQLESIPPESNMGLGCGNPTEKANIKPGEVVLDLGSGGGLDVFLAAEKAGPSGVVIGLDVSEEMIALARRNATKHNLRPPQVSFVRASLTEDLPIASSSVDCVLSNCVINLLPPSGKAHIIKEIYRVLKPGGRVILDDIVAKQPLPEDIKNDLTSHINCISGAIRVEEYKGLLNDAGLVDALLVDTHKDLNVYYQVSEGASAPTSCCCGPQKSNFVKPPQPDFDANAWVAAYDIFAIKSAEDKAEINPVPLLRWWDAYPTVKSSVGFVTSDELASLMRDSSKTRQYAVIDVRRNDHGGGHVRGSHQWAAQTFYDNLPEFYQRFKNTEQVIFYCGSSNGRGPRCAGWWVCRYIEAPMEEDHDVQGGGFADTFHLNIADTQS